MVLHVLVMRIGDDALLFTISFLSVFIRKIIQVLKGQFYDSRI